MKRRRRLWILVVGCAGMLCLVCILAVTVPLFLFRTFRVVGRSMEPALYAGDLVFINPRAYRDHPPERGDIVVFQDSQGRFLFMRVVGLPSEQVAIRDGGVFINGNLLPEPYIDQLTRPGPVSECTLSNNELFLLGDNRGPSGDSRSFGPVPLERVVGRAVCVVSPERVEVIPRVAYPPTASFSFPPPAHPN